ncbi:hypothetical protein ACM61V_03700 [Sphingomonas sp. TX0543]|uniref:hypothetical protein n=1 Tax=unclassified Sphingomonas TaxID=196159 RepID=UPI0010F47090|nr:hypothetical protein [Sphingomonas sp. 3P27F8]
MIWLVAVIWQLALSVLALLLFARNGVPAWPRRRIKAWRGRYVRCPRVASVTEATREGVQATEASSAG